MYIYDLACELSMQFMDIYIYIYMYYQCMLVRRYKCIGYSYIYLACVPKRKQTTRYRNLAQSIYLKETGTLPVSYFMQSGTMPVYVVWMCCMNMFSDF